MVNIIFLVNSLHVILFFFFYNDLLKGEHKLKAYFASKQRNLQTMNFDTNLIKIGGELRKIRTIEY